MEKGESARKEVPICLINYLQPVVAFIPQGLDDHIFVFKG